jgi:hypothetical protein
LRLPPTGAEDAAKLLAGGGRRSFVEKALAGVVSAVPWAGVLGPEDSTCSARRWLVCGLRAEARTPNQNAESWTMNADGSDEVTTGVQCSDVGCAPRWQPQ